MSTEERPWQPDVSVTGGSALPPADPWIHRANGMRCKTCMWFVPKMAVKQALPKSYDLGRCRRHAPAMGGFPVTFVNDWCGDHRIDENKF